MPQAVRHQEPRVAAHKVEYSHLVLERPYADLISAADRMLPLPRGSGWLAPCSSSARALLSSCELEAEAEAPPTLWP